MYSTISIVFGSQVTLYGVCKGGKEVASIRKKAGFNGKTLAQTSTQCVVIVGMNIDGTIVSR